MYAPPLLLSCVCCFFIISSGVIHPSILITFWTTHPLPYIQQTQTQTTTYTPIKQSTNQPTIHTSWIVLASHRRRRPFSGTLSTAGSFMIFLTSLIRRVHFFVGCPHTYIFRRCCFSLVTLFLFVVFTFLVCVYLTCLLYIWSDLAANLEGKGIWRFDF